MAQITEMIAPGIEEQRVAFELEMAMRRLGAKAAAFDIIVASGLNGAFPHYSPDGTVLKAGDFVTIDWGAKLGGYVSDITRTVLVGGNPPTAQQRKVYETVLRAKELSTAAIRPGVTGKEVDSIARDVIAEAGYGQYFGHGLGHSIGRQVHDGATLSPRSDKVVLKPGMVTTVEPGIYIDGWGGVRLKKTFSLPKTDTKCSPTWPLR